MHVEQLLDDRTWLRLDELMRRRPGDLVPLALLRPPDLAFDEDERIWLLRARAIAARCPVGLHTHWTSPTHARPTYGVPAVRVAADAEWLREHGFSPRYFCGGGWYSDEAVRETVAELGLVDCTPRAGEPAPGVLPTTHTLGDLAHALLAPLPRYLHAYIHDHDLIDPRRRTALYLSLRVLRLRSGASGPVELSPASGH